MLTQQEYNDECVAKYSLPDNSIVYSGGKEWARNRLLVCPQCKQPFYAYQPQDGEHRDFHEPEPEVRWPGVTDCIRSTCGHPLCIKAEENHQLERGGLYAKQCREYNSNHEQDKPKEEVKDLRTTGLQWRNL